MTYGEKDFKYYKQTEGQTTNTLCRKSKMEFAKKLPKRNNAGNGKSSCERALKYMLAALNLTFQNNAKALDYC